MWPAVYSVSILLCFDVSPDVCLVATPFKAILKCDILKKTKLG